MKWKTIRKGEVNPFIFSRLLVTNDILCIGVHREFVALNTSTGKEKWSVKQIPLYPCGAIQASVSTTPIKYKDLVYTNIAGYMVAFDINTGKEKWRFEAGSNIYSSPIIKNGLIYFGASGLPMVEMISGIIFQPKIKKFQTDQAYLFAIDAKTGKQKWRFKTKGEIRSSPAIYNDVLYFGGHAGLYALNIENGKQKWLFKTANRGIFGSPIVSKGTIYVGARDNNFYAIDAKTGKEKWKFYTRDSIASGVGAVISNNTIYFGTTDNFYALDTKTGKKLWEFKTYGDITTPIIEDSVVYFGAGDNVYGLGLATGEKRFFFRTGEKNARISGPVIVNDVMYIGFNKTICAISIDNPIYNVLKKMGKKNL
ncbi:PQQ-binding-like beta-propeller repeat protein [Candidatus Auribacterota bacterium]